MGLPMSNSEDRRIVIFEGYREFEETHSKTCTFSGKLMDWTVIFESRGIVYVTHFCTL